MQTKSGQAWRTLPALALAAGLFATVAGCGAGADRPASPPPVISTGSTGADPTDDLTFGDRALPGIGFDVVSIDTDGGLVRRTLSDLTD